MTNKIKIALNSNESMELRWTDNDNFLKYYGMQRLEPFRTVQSDYTGAIEAHVNKWWRHRYCKLYSVLPDNAKILDVGCGCAIMDLIASKYNRTFDFYLLDKGDLFKEWVWFNEKHVFYHSWDIVQDFIINSKLVRDQFNFLTPESEWPEELDLVTSFFSWGFHYPVQNEFGYWEKVLKKLKRGGYLYMDISNNHLQVHPEAIEFISDSLKSRPTINPYQFKSGATNKNYIWKDGSMGYACYWIKNI